jgi:hypothetical protein
MAIHKALNPPPQGLEESEDWAPDSAVGVLEIEVEEMDGEGGTIIDLFEPEPVPFSANLAEHLDDSELNSIASELYDFFETDLASRADWEQTYKDGLDLLGLTIESRTEPWDGACGVTHPLLAEAVVRFQSETIMETFPAGGPVKTKIIGMETKERLEAAERVRDDMNHWLVDRMPDYRSEYERLLWGLPIAGVALKKVYYSTADERPVAVYVPAEDFIISYGATDIASAPRYAHRMKKTKNELRKLQAAGFYLDTDLGDPQMDTSEIQQAKDDKTGVDAIKDDRYTLLEYHVDLSISLDNEDEDEDDEGGKSVGGAVDLPYVVHMELGTQKILAVYRNWEEDDPLRRKRVHFAKYGYIPGFGFYDFGLVHLVGGFAKGATSLLRQLVDAGTLSNLPGGLKARGLRIKGDNAPISPGEWRDVDVPGGSIRDNLMPLPYKEPSPVLYDLLQNVVAEGRRFAAVADVNVADLQPNAPVGSVLAVLERTLKTMSAIQARVHYALKQELRLLRDIIRDHTPDTYTYDPAHAAPEIKQSDYDTVEIIPVSDPNATTLSQRIAQYQAALQLAQMNPELYDMPVLHRQMLEVLGVRNVDALLPDHDNIPPMDPISENMAMLTSKPVRAYEYQDHEAHIQAHVTFGRDPTIMALLQNNPKAPEVAAAGAAHIAEHLAFLYRRQIEEQLGVPLPKYLEQLPEDVEVDLSRLVAQASGKLLQKHTAEAAQQQNQEQMQDPVIQMQMQELQLKQGELQRKAQKDQMDHQIDQQRLLLEQERMRSEERRTATMAGARLTTENMRNDLKEKTEALRAAIDIAQSEMGRDRMNEKRGAE